MGKKHARQIRRRVRCGRTEEKNLGIDCLGSKRPRSGKGGRFHERSDKKKARRKRGRDVDEIDVGKAGRDLCSKEDTDDNVIEENICERTRMNEPMTSFMETTTVRCAKISEEAELCPDSSSSAVVEKCDAMGIAIEHRQWFRKRRKSKILFGGRFVWGDAYLEYYHRTTRSGVTGGLVDIVHTYVPPSLRGRGIAMHLVDAAYSFASVARFSVVPTCSYVSDTYLQRRQKRSKITVDKA